LFSYLNIFKDCVFDSFRKSFKNVTRALLGYFQDFVQFHYSFFFWKKESVVISSTVQAKGIRLTGLSVTKFFLLYNEQEFYAKIMAFFTDVFIVNFF